MKTGLSKLVNQYSHDIKSPLAKIKAISLITMNSTDPDTLKKGLARIDLAADLLNNNLENLFTLININEGKDRLNYQFIDLNELFIGLSKKYEFRFKAGPKLEILADSLLLKKALQILIESILDKNRSLAITGKGENKKTIITMKFAKSEMIKNSKPALGWTLAREIIRLHKGKLVEKKVGSAAKIQIIL